MTNCSIKWLIWGKIEGLRGRLMVGQQTLDLFILVRIQAPQPDWARSLGVKQLPLKETTESSNLSEPTLRERAGGSFGELF